MKFIKFGDRYKVIEATVLLGWIQPFHFFGEKPARYVYRQSPQAYLLPEENLLTIAGFLSAINEAQPLKSGASVKK